MSIELSSKASTRHEGGQSKGQEMKIGKKSSWCMGLDNFSESFHMKIESDGSMYLPSCAGSLCSFLLFFMVFGYAVQKIDIMYHRKEHDITESMVDSYFDHDYIFDY